MLGTIHFNREIILGIEPLQNRQQGVSDDTFNNLVECEKSVQEEKNKPRTHRRHGLNGIGSKGKRKLRNGCAILERKYGKSRLTFATVTIPKLNEPDREYLHENWGDFCYSWQKEMRREAERNGFPDLQIVMCTEIQEKRFKTYGDVYLHLHAVWCGRPEGNYKYYITADRAREITQRLLVTILGRRSRQELTTVQLGGINNLSSASQTSSTTIPTPRLHLTNVKKSAARYLSKYLSKGGKILEEVKAKGLANSLPKQWWNMTRKLSKVCEDAKQKLDCTLSEFIIDNYQELIRMRALDFFRLVKIEIDEQERIVGGVGKLSKLGMEMFGLKIKDEVLNTL